MNVCIKCGCSRISGPRYVENPYGRGELLYNCTRCGYSTSEPTRDASTALETAQRVRWIDYRKLRDNVTQVVIGGLHYMFNIERINKLQTADEVNLAINGGATKYRTDAIFRAKVESFVARLMTTIDEAVAAQKDEK